MSGLSVIAVVGLSSCAGVVAGFLLYRSLAGRRRRGSPARVRDEELAGRAEDNRSHGPGLDGPGLDGPGLGGLREAVEHLAHGIVVADGTGQVVYRNNAASMLPSARHGRPLVEDCVQRQLTRARAGESCSEEVELFGPPSELYFVSAHPFGDGDRRGAMAVVEDRSEIRLTETIRRDFVSNISHELKTPIGAIGLLAEAIEGETEPEVMRRLAARMVMESDRAANTIDDLLELSRIELADDVELTEVRLDEVIGESVARIANAAEQAGVAIRTEPADAPTVRGDRRQLASALFNLLDNAIKYSQQGGEVRVVSAPDRNPGRARLIVSDDGIGIPRASLDRVFERFYRVDGARARNTGGTGLGLAIVRHVVHNHGGEVLVDSVEGRGSVFTIVLPAAGAATGTNSGANGEAAGGAGDESAVRRTSHSRGDT